MATAVYVSLDPSLRWDDAGEGAEVRLPIILPHLRDPCEHFVRKIL